MKRDPQSTGGRAPVAQHDADRPSAAGAAQTGPFPIVAVAVTILLVGALIFSALAARLHAGPGAAGLTTPTARTLPTTSAATRTVPVLPPNTSVVSIAMVSASDGWAIAEPAGGAALLHYTGGRWTPSGDTYPGVYLGDISMDAHDDGWAVGGHADQATGVVLHYSGGRWGQVQTPHIQFAGMRVWAFSPSHVVVLASLPKGTTGAASSALLRYDHGAWTEITSPRGISDMAMLSSTDLWATCFDGHILHYLSGRWTTYTIGGQGAGPGTQPLSISMLSDSDGWAAGLTNAAPQGMFLARFDGHAWTRVQGPAASYPTEIHSIAMVSSNEGWAGGDLLNTTGIEAVLLHYVYGQWETTPAPSDAGIEKIVMLSATEGWAAVGGGPSAGLLHYQNGRWTPYHLGA